MLVQAQVVPWWGTGRPAECSPSGFHPVTGIAHRQEDRRVRLQKRRFRYRAHNHTRSREMTKALSGLEIWLGRSNRSRAGLADASTTRVQARRVRADPTADRKPKACQ